MSNVSKCSSSAPTRVIPTTHPAWFDSLREAKMIYQCGDRVVWVVDDQFILKRMRYTINSEAPTHEFVNSKTDIPVPHVFAEWLSADTRTHYLLEGRIPGQTLGDCWGQLTNETRIRLAQQVALYMAQLARAFRGKRMQSVARQPLPINCFVPGADEPRGPLKGRWATDEDIFNNEFLPGLKSKGLPDALIRLVGATMPPCRGQLAFTHCDLYVGNIMVDPAHGVVTAIIDWESAGYWPEWFQYARITHGCSPADGQWKYILGRVSRGLIPHADHGRVWLDMVGLFMHRPDSLQARAWLRLLIKYLKGEASSREMREYESIDGRDQREQIEREGLLLNGKGYIGNVGYYSSAMRCE
ncbi:kinase-like domain-containing protein [Chaetomium fimeti]|uniref:Kinase-like domain-containing protein n=1 Tax=Chaetomium fimeti TaxID=1854472 RepID=A0AAE0HIP4_9PEZI|nr:kinase-like domain-containing protein [Chaetomium fimeti]